MSLLRLLRRSKPDPAVSEKSYLVVGLGNIGAEYQLTPHVQVGLNIRNLFNTQYSQSGMNTVLVPQRGRWYMANIGIKI